jgi:murein DD-endopeptidase MepM/ murein hydrolase activator NlpD
MPFASPVVAFYPTPPSATHVFPVVAGASFSNDWGGPRPGGRRHQGIDLFAKTGTPVVAISDGILFRVGWNRVGGWRFWLRDRWGNEFYHAHLSAFAPAAKEGATVKAGTVIGFVGNTGDARGTPPHVHFEIHPGGGDPIPPFSYVSAWPRV